MPWWRLDVLPLTVGEANPTPRPVLPGILGGLAVVAGRFQFTVAP